MNISRFLKNDCRGSVVVLIRVLMGMLFFKLTSRNNILPYPGTIIQGSKNIDTGGSLKIGLSSAGFVHRHDTTLLNIRGKMTTDGNFGIGRGCRFDIGPNGHFSVGHNTTVNALSDFIIMHRLRIGHNCVISWKCQFLDDDFHELEYSGKKPAAANGINIGDKVWIGSGVSIYKNTSIPNGCVVAANSVVRGRFTTENALIAGNPARIIKENVTWQ